MYLLNRSALPINSNPGMVFPKATFSDSNEQLRYVHGGWLDCATAQKVCRTVEQSREWNPSPNRHIFT